MGGQIFICYRRNDARGSARAIYERLAEKFGKERIYFDVERSTAGLWKRKIAEQLTNSAAVVVVIGKEWLSAQDEVGRRIDLDNDPVRVEIETAIERRIPIFPVLVDGAALPKRADLPASLATLPDWQSIEITESRFEFDAQKLISELAAVAPPRRGSPRFRSVAIGTALVVLAGAAWLAYFVIAPLFEEKLPDIPQGVALIDLKDGPVRDFDFAPLPGMTLLPVRMLGKYSTKDGIVSGEVKSGSLEVSDNFDSKFASRIERISVRACYLRKIDGAYQRDGFPRSGKTTNSKEINTKYGPGDHIALPAFTFSFPLPSDARPGKIWLCAALENPSGYIPAE